MSNDPMVPAPQTLAVAETTEGPIIAVVKAVPFYKRWHQGGSYALGFVSVCGVVGTMTGPPPFIPADVWGFMTFLAIIVATFFKAQQSGRGSTAIAIPTDVAEPPKE